MYINDEALIYKHYENLYYAITKKNGKIILKNFYFKEKYPQIKSFFFANYEYDKEVFKKSENKNHTQLITEYIEIESIISLNKLTSNILLLQYIFDYCIGYKIQINEIWFFLENLLKKEDIINIQEIYIFLNIILFSNENNKYINNEKEIINKIKDILIELNPHHKNYIYNLL